MVKYSRSKVLIFTLIFTMLTIFITPVYAAKPGTGGGTNSAPVITQPQTDTYNLTTTVNTSINIMLAASDPNRDTLQWDITVAPEHGTASPGTVTNVRGKSTYSFTYAPYSDYTGSDQFLVQVKDNKGGLDTVTVNITVNPAADLYYDYVALGDSIATGTVYPGKTITSYVTYFKNYLVNANPGKIVRTYNLARDGVRTNELYADLGLDGSAGNASIVSAVKGAEVITISIGGNNLMQAAKDDSALGGYDFFNIDTADAEAGLKDFQNQFIPIIERIKYLNPKAKIIVNKQYNPYDVSSDAYLHGLVDGYLFRGGSGLNDLVISNASLGYSIADVYSRFDYYSDNMAEVVYLYYKDFWEWITRSPHPRDLGQTIIYEECVKAYIGNK
jgi:lysophospholipase L1-like esterase